MTRAIDYVATVLVLGWPASGAAFIAHTFPAGQHGWAYWVAFIPATILGILGRPLCWLSGLAYWLVP